MDLTNQEIMAINYKIGLENNAMLRLIMSNQKVIMDKLKIEQEYPIDIFQDFDPIEFKKKRQVNPFDFIRRVFILVEEAAWRWVKIHPKFYDDFPDEGK